MADAIRDNIRYGKAVRVLDTDERIVITEDGEQYKADVIVNTILWIEFKDIKGMPDGIKDLIHRLKYSSIQIDYFPEELDTGAQWIDHPDPSKEQFLPWEQRVLDRNKL